MKNSALGTLTYELMKSCNKFPNSLQGRNLYEENLINIIALLLTEEIFVR